MSHYQVIARRFRPKSFKDVIGQEPIVTTLKNAIKFGRVAQAYLFCGSRGTGKTTLARLFAKALNCEQLTSDGEPCNTCSSCREITSGASLDVLEIDGASHRGIEDIRQIKENVGYTTASGRCKIYIIDEVHMLTKEAFNALLKTLEEPPPKVKFFFATTEAHKLPATIISRCQRFNLNRIPFDKIIKKLKFISQHLEVKIEEEALLILAQQAEGGLRDAESLLDQMLAFTEGTITAESVNAILGLMPKEAYFELDVAGKEGNFAKAFEIAHLVFSQGKNINHFLEGLVEHFRTILLVKLSSKEAPFLSLSEKEKEQYESTAHLYSQEQCLNLINYLLDIQNQVRFSLSAKVALEAILLHIIRSHFRLPIEVLVRRLSELELSLAQFKQPAQLTQTIQPVQSIQSIQPAQSAQPKQSVVQVPLPPSIQAHVLPSLQAKTDSKPSTPIVKKPVVNSSISEDPTPSAADLGIKKNPPASKEPLSHSSERKPERKPEKSAHYYDTLVHFAAVELEGKLQKHMK